MQPRRSNLLAAWQWVPMPSHAMREELLLRLKTTTAATSRMLLLLPPPPLMPRLLALDALQMLRPRPLLPVHHAARRRQLWSVMNAAEALVIRIVAAALSPGLGSACGAQMRGVAAAPD